MPILKTYRRRFLSLILGMAACALATATHAARIDGLNPLEPVTADGVVPVVDEGTMQINLPDGRRLTIAPWPEFLPKRFGKQAVSGTRLIQPAGPIDRLSFSRVPEPSPWLVIGNGARRSTLVIDNWQLQLSGRRWLVNDGRTKKNLQSKTRQAMPAMVNVGPDRWCIYLLESAIPAGKPNIATEAEPQIGWAAIRLSPLQRKCTAQK